MVFGTNTTSTEKLEIVDKLTAENKEFVLKLIDKIKDDKLRDEMIVKVLDSYSGYQYSPYLSFSQSGAIV